MADSTIARARRAVPAYFGRLPVADLVVMPFPDHEVPSAPPGQYFAPSDDGSRPWLYRINLYGPTTRRRATAETIAFYEAIPGHHFQIALAMERPAAHPISRFLIGTAFAEGWGLYASDLDRLGMLAGSTFRAARLVVDTGLHALVWSRQQAVDDMRANTAETLNQIEAEVDRYIISPGQATAYMTGDNEIVALRAEAEATLGERFDLRAFHSTFSRSIGSVTAPSASTSSRWVAERR